MKILSQFVALMIAVAIVAMPAAALANCPTSASNTPHGCCASAMEGQARIGMNTVAESQPCCDMSSGRPTPTTQLQAPVSSTAVVNPPQVSALAAIAPVRSGLQDAAPLKFLSSSQAVLCTFLI